MPWIFDAIPTPVPFQTRALAFAGGVRVRAGYGPEEDQRRALATTSEGRVLYGGGSLPLEEVRSLAVHGAGEVYLAFLSRGLFRADLTLSGAVPVPLPPGLGLWCVASSPAGLWVGGQSLQSSQDGRVAFAAPGEPLRVIAQGLEGFVTRLVPWRDGVLAVHGKSVSYVTLAGPGLLKKFVGGVANVAAHGQTLVALNKGGLQTSTNGGAAWKGSLTFERKLYDGEAAGIAVREGRWLAKATNQRPGFGMHLVSSTDGKLWEPLPNGDACALDDIIAAPDGFEVAGRSALPGAEEFGSVFRVRWTE